MNPTDPPQPGILTEMLSILFPVRCVHCGRGGNWLCPACADALDEIGPDRCGRCGRPVRAGPGSCAECRGRSLPFISARAAFCFSGPARSLVHSLKYSGQRRLATFMAGLSASGLAELTGQFEVDTLIPVPLHGSKRVSRGYNQAGLYARALSRRLGLRHQDILCKRRLTVPQNRLDYGARRKNQLDSFSLKRGIKIRGSGVVVIDDVYTTGSTAAECARIIREELGVDVYIWTFARAVRHRSRKAENPNTTGNRQNRWEG